MVFVTVGNAHQPFSRLVLAVDRLAGEGVLASPIVVQHGHTPFVPRHSRARPFLPMADFEEHLRSADLVISHGGCTVMSAIRLGKMPIVMPRRKRYGEHVNDHQVQLVDALAAEQRIIPVHEPEDLEAAVLEARRRTRTALPPPASHMLELVAQAVAEMTGRRP